MKQTFTRLEITRLAYTENKQNLNDTPLGHTAEEYWMLKEMRRKVDACLVDPSEESMSKIYTALYSR